MNKLKKIPLSEIISTVIDYRGKTPKKLGSDWANEGYRVLSAKNVKTRKIVNEQSIRYVDEHLYKKWMKEEIQREDILITSEAPFGQIFFWDSDEKIVLSQRLFAIRCKEEFYPNYIFQYMTGENFQKELLSRATGTTVTGLRQSELLKCTLEIPEYANQIKIASIIRTFDDLIAINDKIIRNLCLIAKLIYGNFSNRATNSARLGSLIDIKYGKAHKKLNDGNIPVYGSGGKIRSVDKFIYDCESILIPRKGSLNNIIYTNEPFWVTDTMFFTEMKEQHLCKYIYEFLNTVDLASKNVGSAVPSMTIPILEALSIKLPGQGQLETYEKLVSPLFEAKANKIRENISIAKIRDFLLPKFLSGKIELPN